MLREVVKTASHSPLSYFLAMSSLRLHLIAKSQKVIKGGQHERQFCFLWGLSVLSSTSVFNDVEITKF